MHTLDKSILPIHIGQINSAHKHSLRLIPDSLYIYLFPIDIIYFHKLFVIKISVLVHVPVENLSYDVLVMFAYC